MNKIKSIVVAGLAITLGLASCDSGNLRRSPGHIYAPDMTYSRAYDAYTSNPNFAAHPSWRDLSVYVNADFCALFFKSRV